jgi:aminoglycoside phosphotransferase (APT) family kinase protein
MTWLETGDASLTIGSESFVAESRLPMTDPAIAGAAADPWEAAVAAFVVEHLGCQASVLQRLRAFAINAVYEVEAGGRRLVVKASPMHDALRGEVWACGRGLHAGCPVPAVLGFGPLGSGLDMSAFVMSLVDGIPLEGPHPALREVGVRLRQLHEARVPGFGSLSDAAWDDAGRFSLRHGSWRSFLDDVVGETRALAGRYAIASDVADEAAGALDARQAALSEIEVGSLCHGDLKVGHVLVDDDRLAGVIDWGDAVVGDPLWDIARFAHRAEAASLSLLLEGYDPGRVLVDDLAWRLPLYGALWMLVDVIVDHRLGSRVDKWLLTAMDSLRGI